MNLSSYLHLKQSSLISKLNYVLLASKRYSDNNSRRKPQLVYVKYVHVNRSYGKLLCEINDYNQIISRYLDIIFFIFIIIIAYLSFILFLNTTILLISAIIASIYISNIMIVVCVILACASITTGNEAMSKRTLQLFNISLKRHFHTVQLMKVCTKGMDFVSQKQLIPD